MNIIPYSIIVIHAIEHTYGMIGRLTPYSMNVIHGDENTYYMTIGCSMVATK